MDNDKVQHVQIFVRIPADIRGWRLHFFIYHRIVLHCIVLYCQVVVCQPFIKLMIDWSCEMDNGIEVFASMRNQLCLTVKYEVMEVVKCEVIEVVSV